MIIEIRNMVFKIYHFYGSPTTNKITLTSQEVGLVTKYEMVSFVMYL